MAEKGSDNVSDEIINIKCSVCVGKNITRGAEKYCVECQDYYCIPCTDTHKTFPALRGHILLDKADFNKHQLQSSLPCFPTERCPIHKAKLLDMFCRNHDEVVCATCIAISHRTCQDIHSVPDEVDNLYKQSASDQTMKQLIAEKKDAEEIKKAKQQLLKELMKQKTKAAYSIKVYIKELEAELKLLETESIKQVDMEYASKERDLLGEIKEIDKQIADLEQTADKLQKSNGNISQEFVCIKIAQKTVVTAKSSKSSIQKQPDVKINFSADMKIKNYLKQLKEIGQVSSERATYKQRTTAYTVVQQKDIDIKLTTDKGACIIYGSCFVGDGSLLLADLDNKRLKRLDDSIDAIIDHLDLDAGPIAVCLTSKEEAAVSLNNRTIQFVSLIDKMIIRRRMKMDHYCCGLAFNAGKLFISDESMAVYIHDIAGAMLHKITTNKSGKQIFWNSKHISISTNRDCVYVADGVTGLMTLDIQGDYLSAFTDPDLHQLFGVCTDRRGNIFVSGRSSKNINQINEYSKMKLNIIETKPNPLSVCFDPNQNKLVVSHQGINTITVYELQ